MNIGSVLKQLFSAFPSVQVSAETTAVYMRLLKDIPIEELQVIVDQAVATCKYLPTVAELRDLRHGLQNHGRLSWTEAWESVQREMRRIGSYGVPSFPDPLTARVVASMGWRNLCLSETQMADRAHFRDMYQALAVRCDFDAKLLPQARMLAERCKSLPVPLRELMANVEVKP